MQGTLGGSLRPCTSLLHASLSHRASSLHVANFGQRLLTASVFGRESRNFHAAMSLSCRRASERRGWPRRDAERTLGLGLRRHLAVVAAKRNMLTELQSIREEADAGMLSLICHNLPGVW
jgi:hypothetical protein